VQGYFITGNTDNSGVLVGEAVLRAGIGGGEYIADRVTSPPAKPGAYKLILQFS